MGELTFLWAIPGIVVIILFLMWLFCALGGKPENKEGARSLALVPKVIEVTPKGYSTKLYAVRLYRLWGLYPSNLLVSPRVLRHSFQVSPLKDIKNVTCESIEEVEAILIELKPVVETVSIRKVSLEEAKMDNLMEG